MKPTGLRLRLLALALLLPAAALALEPGAPAPDFALPSTAGANERLSERRGRVVLLAFWSSRCGSCDRHLRSLARLAEAHAAEGAELLVVSIDRSPEASRALAASLGVPVLLDAGREVADLYRLSPLPVTHLVDRHGHLRTTRREARKPERELVEASLRALLEE
ncbi:MAG: redoxin domain-containing protein [Pseudomonadales bacterium]|jgi:peroxiredoxin|nr:redoxin domain-containing protein [Pseudomonadales bacterium]